MVDKRISELDPAGPLTGDELVELVQEVGSKLDNVRSPLRDIVEQLALQGPQGLQGEPGRKAIPGRRTRRPQGEPGPAGIEGRRPCRYTRTRGCQRCAWYRWR